MAYEVPTNSRSPHDGPTTIRESSKIFGEVAAKPPQELIDKYGFQTIGAAIQEANQQRIEIEGEGYDEFYKDLVNYGYRDISKAIEDLIPGHTIEERLEAVRDHRTLMALGILAARSESSMHSALENDQPYGDRLVVERDRDDKPYLRMIEDQDRRSAEINRRSGCPFAALNSDKLPSLPYIQFAVWAGEVNIRLRQREYDIRHARGY